MDTSPAITGSAPRPVAVAVSSVAKSAGLSAALVENAMANN
jgi:hypothetical protein